MGKKGGVRLFLETSSAMAKISGGTCYIIEPEVYGESFLEFEATYSDHFPVFVHYRIL